MWRTITTTFFLSLLFLSFFVSHVHAEDIDLEVQNCLQSRYGYFFCSSYLDQAVISCLKNLPESSAGWNCSPASSDADIKRCAEAFSGLVCRNVQGLYGTIYNCQGDCAKAESGYTFKLQSLYKDKAYSKYGVTRPVDTVSQADYCIKKLDKDVNCLYNAKALSECYQSAGPEQGLWSCLSSDSTLDQETCKKDFMTRVEGKLNEVKQTVCSEVKLTDVSGIFVQNHLNNIATRFDTVYELRKTITPTPAIVEPTATPGPASDTSAYEVLNCGFANPNIENADDLAKTKCCPETIDKIKFEPPKLAEDCKWYEALTCGSADRFQSYIVDTVRGNIDNGRGELNKILKDNKGTLPKCFVGTCRLRAEDSNYYCVPEDGAAMCYKYIAGGKTRDELSQAIIDKIAPCEACMKGNTIDGQPKKVYTALGCIDTSFEGIVSQVFSIGIGIAGMIALGCIVYSSFLMQTSQGAPEQVQKAQENITSCITGLVLIILSIFILRIMGVDILRIPGFGG
ncbi:hypothetical protein BH09PAT2_BH09PAT2_00330 [soil metagenome]